jgi:hypothetical protein
MSFYHYLLNKSRKERVKTLLILGVMTVICLFILGNKFFNFSKLNDVKKYTEQVKNFGDKASLKISNEVIVLKESCDKLSQQNMKR